LYSTVYNAQIAVIYILDVDCIADVKR